MTKNTQYPRIIFDRKVSSGTSSVRYRIIQKENKSRENGYYLVIESSTRNDAMGNPIWESPPKSFCEQTAMVILQYILTDLKNDNAVDKLVEIVANQLTNFHSGNGVILQWTNKFSQNQHFVIED